MSWQAEPGSRLPTTVPASHPRSPPARWTTCHALRPPVRMRAAVSDCRCRADWRARTALASKPDVLIEVLGGISVVVVMGADVVELVSGFERTRLDHILKLFFRQGKIMVDFGSVYRKTALRIDA